MDDGRKTITVSLDKTVRFWDVATGETNQVVRLPIGGGQQGRLDAAALSKDGKLLAVGGVSAGGESTPACIYLAFDHEGVHLS